MRYPVWNRCCKLPKYDFCISQGSVATVLRWDGQNSSHLHQVSSWCCTHKILKSANVSRSYSKNNLGTVFFLRHSVLSHLFSISTTWRLNGEYLLNETRNRLKIRDRIWKYKGSATSRRPKFRELWSTNGLKWDGHFTHLRKFYVLLHHHALHTKVSNGTNQTLPNGRRLMGNLTAYSFGLKQDINKRQVRWKLQGVSYIVSKCHELWSTNSVNWTCIFQPYVNSAFYFNAIGFADGDQQTELNQTLPNGGQ